MYQLQKLDSPQYPIANAFYKACGDKSKVKSHEQVWLLRDQQQIIAALRLQPKPDSWFCLRSLCVTPQLRRQGFALYFLQVLFKQQPRLAVYCFALAELPELYARAGFSEETEALPPFMLEEQYRYQRKGKDWVLMWRDGR